MDTLTKENFWNEVSEKYPKATAHFKRWIDQYKGLNDWEKLFNQNCRYGTGSPYPDKYPKYHDLPTFMQFGIFIQYAAETMGLKALTANNPRKTIAYHLKKLETNYNDFINN